jgi:hypothetical protein
MLRNHNHARGVSVGRTIIPPKDFPDPDRPYGETPVSPHRGFFVSAWLASHHHIGMVTPALGTYQPLMPIGNGSLGSVSERHFGWIGTCATFGGTK